MINEIKLRNFKTFKEEEIQLAPLTLITGINGMGKSSILQSLLLLKQSHEIGYLEGKKQVDLTNDFVNLESAESLCYIGAADDKQVEITISLENDASHTWLIDAKNPKDVILKCTYQGDGNLDSIPLFNENFIFLEAERWGPRVIYNKKEQRAYNTKLGIQGELTPAYILNSIANNEEIGINNLKHPDLQSEEGGKQLYENINAWMEYIFSVPIKTRVDEESATTVKLSYNMDGGKFSALQVGFGLTYTLPIITALLRAQEGDLILLENPEAHLHPSAQAKMMELICQASKNGVQVLMETHSDHIINGALIAIKEATLSVEDMAIYFVGRDRETQTGQAIKLDVQTSGKIRRPPLDFFDQFDKDLRRLTGF